MVTEPVDAAATKQNCIVPSQPKTCSAQSVYVVCLSKKPLHMLLLYTESEENVCGLPLPPSPPKMNKLSLFQANLHANNMMMMTMIMITVKE